MDKNTYMEFKKSNNLICSYIPENLNTQKLFMLCISKLSRISKAEMVQNPSFELASSEIIKYIGWDSRHAHRIIADASSKLAGIILTTYNSAHDSWVSIPIFSRIEYFPQQHRVIVELNKHAVDMFCEVNVNFTILNFSEISRIGNVKTLRLWEFAKSKSYSHDKSNDHNVYKFSVPEIVLRMVLGTSEPVKSFRPTKHISNDEITHSYESWKDFKKRVLNPAIRENNEISSVQIVSCEKTRNSDEVTFVTRRLPGVKETGCAPVEPVQRKSVSKPVKSAGTSPSAISSSAAMPTQQPMQATQAKPAPTVAKKQYTISADAYKLFESFAENNPKINLSEENMIQLLQVSDNNIDRLSAAMDILQYNLDSGAVIYNPVAWLIRAIQNNYQQSFVVRYDSTGSKSFENVKPRNPSVHNFMERNYTKEDFEELERALLQN